MKTYNVFVNGVVAEVLPNLKEARRKAASLLEGKVEGPKVRLNTAYLTSTGNVEVRQVVTT